MAMGTGGSGLRVEINMTPMIDVLLVLIIIFMVVQTSKTRGLNTEVPQPSDGQSATPREDIVIEVTSDHSIQLNRQPVEAAALGGRLKDLWKLGANRVIFVKGARELDFVEIAQVIDIAKGAGYNRIALMTP